MHMSTTLAILASATVSVAEYAYRQPPLLGRQAFSTGAPYPTGTGTGVINPIFPTGGPTAAPGGLYPNITTTSVVVVSPLPIPDYTYGQPPTNNGNNASPTSGAGDNSGSGAGAGAGSGSGSGSGSDSGAGMGSGDGSGSGSGDDSFNSTAPEEYTGAASAYSRPSGLTPYISTLAGLALFAIVV